MSQKSSRLVGASRNKILEVFLCIFRIVELLVFISFLGFLFLVIIIQESVNKALLVSPFVPGEMQLFLMLTTWVVCVAIVPCLGMLVWAFFTFIRRRKKIRLIAYSLLIAGCVFALIRSPWIRCYVWGSCGG